MTWWRRKREPEPEPMPVLESDEFGYRVWMDSEGHWRWEVLLLEAGDDGLLERSLRWLLTEEGAHREAINTANRYARMEAADARREAAPIIRREAAS